MSRHTNGKVRGFTARETLLIIVGIAVFFFILLSLAGRVRAAADLYYFEASAGGIVADSVGIVHYQDGDSLEYLSLPKATNSDGGNGLYYRDTINVDNALNSRFVERWYYPLGVTSHESYYSAPYAGDQDSVLAALGDVAMANKMWVKGSYTKRDYLDAAISSRSTFDPLTDSVMIDISIALASNLFSLMADSVWQSAFVDRDGIPGSFADSAKNWAATSASSLDSAAVSRILRRVVYGLPTGSGSDSTTLAERKVMVADILAAAIDKILEYDTSLIAAGFGEMLKDTSAYQGAGAGSPWTVAQRDSLLDAITDANKVNFMADVSALATANQVTLVIDTVNGIIDTLQNLQAWIPLAADIYTYFIAGSNEDAFKANIAGLATTADLVVIVDTVNGIIDTLQNLQNWIPTAAAIYTYFTTGSNEDIFKADITQVPDSATLSRMMHRIVWGIAQGVGDDSTTLAQRLITVASMAGAVARQIADSVLNDSLALQGAASGLTAGEIATAVNDTLGAYHGAASWLTGGIGTGPNDLTIFTIDTSQTPDDTLSSILTIVDNLTGTLEASGLTLSDGAFTAKLSLGSWLLSAGLNSSRWAFDDIPFTVTLPFDTVAILGYEVVVPSPTDPAKANVYGDVSDIMGNPIPGIVVKIELERTMNVTSPAPGALFATAAYDTTDATGRFSREIVRSTVYGTTPADSVRSLYHVTGTYNRRFTVFVIDSLYIPATGNVDLTQAIRDRY